MAEDSTFRGTIAIQDVVLPVYRQASYEKFATRVDGRLSILTGRTDDATGVVTATAIEGADYTAVNLRRYLPLPATLMWQPGVVEWLAECRPEVLIASGNVRLLSTHRARRWARRQGIPVLGWGLGTMMLASGLEWIRRPLRNRFYRGFDGIVAYSSRARDEYERAGVAPERIFVVHNCIAPRPTEPAPERPATFVERPRVLFVGRVYAGKRLDLIVDAVARFPKESRPVIEIVGDGPHRDDIEAYAASKLDDDDIVFSGKLFGAELTAAFDRADLFVLPGLGGLAIQEAMARALPVIVGEADGTQDDLVRPGNGWPFVPPTADHLHELIAEAFEDPARLRRMGLESYRIVSEELNLDQMIVELVDASNRIREMGVAG